MPSWLIRLRDVVWVSVLAVTLAVLSIFCALFVDGSFDVVIALSGGAITFGLLAQRV
jgi:hypothetical protein